MLLLGKFETKIKHFESKLVSLFFKAISKATFYAFCYMIVLLHTM